MIRAYIVRAFSFIRKQQRFLNFEGVEEFEKLTSDGHCSFHRGFKQHRGVKFPAYFSDLFLYVCVSLTMDTVSIQEKVFSF